jgi:hypothetical protein
MDKAEGERALLDLHDILEKLGMKYFLVMGTALGAYRDKGFTPTEKDIDIGFLYENFTPYIGDLARELVLSGFAVRPISRPFRKCRVLVASRNDVKIDLVTYVLWRDRRFCSNADHKTKPYSIVHHRSILENYQKLEVFGREFLVPSPIEEYLSLEYGPAWRVPVQDHRSRTRVYEFRNLVGIQDDFLDS